jgi:hypothetical protein
MTELTVDCPNCAADIEPATILESLAIRETNSATDLVEHDDDVDLRCPECEQDVTLRTGAVIVRLSAHNPILAVLNTMKENEKQRGGPGWTEGIKEAIEREQESFQRKQEIRQAAEELQNDLDE